MTLRQVALEGTATAHALPLQFGGDLIDLAFLFLVLALVAAVLGVSDIAGLNMRIVKCLIISS